MSEETPEESRLKDRKKNMINEFLVIIQMVILFFSAYITITIPGIAGFGSFDTEVYIFCFIMILYASMYLLAWLRLHVSRENVGEIEHLSVYLDNSMQRREKARRNSNIIGGLSIFAVLEPEIIQKLDYVNALSGTEHQWKVFVALIVICLYSMLMLADATQEVKRLENKIEIVDRTNFRFIVPYKATSDFVTHILPDLLITVGLATSIFKLMLIGNNTIT